VITNGSRNAANVAAIETYGRTRVLWQLSRIKPLNTKSLGRAAMRLAKALRG